MPALIGAIGTVVNMNQAVYGNAMGNPAYQSQLAVATATGGQAALIAGYNSSLASQANATLATTVLNNMFVTTAAGVSAANVAALTTALTQAFAAYPTAKGQVISNLANLLGGLEGEASWGPAATAFNNQAAADFVYSTNTANTNSGVPSTTTTFTLTAGVDTFTGSAGGDTFSGVLNAAGNVTWQAFDTLIGGNGTDTLIAQGVGNLTLGAGGLVSVENIQLFGQVAGTAVDITTATGVTSIVINTPAGAATVAGVGTGIQSVAVTGQGSAGADNQTFTFQNAASSGATDSITLALTNVGATGAIDTVILQPTTGTNGYETVNLTNSSVASNIILNDGGSTTMATINVAATANLTLQDDTTTVLTYNAAASTAEVVMRTNTVGAVTMTGGTANDTFRFVSNDGTTGTYGTTDTVTGGTGTDTLVLTAAQATVTTAQTAVTGVERIAILTAAGAGTTVNVTNFGATDLRFDLLQANAFSATLGATAATLNMQNFGSANAINVTANGTGTADVLNITGGTTAAANTQTGDITVNGYETINVTALGAAATGGAAFGAIIAVPSAGATVNFLGAQNIAVGAITASIIDASGMTGSATFAQAAGSALSARITGTANADTLIGSTAADVINGGAGADNISNQAAAASRASAADYMTGGAGQDTFNFFGSNASAAYSTAINGASYATDFTYSVTATATDILGVSDTLTNYAAFAGNVITSITGAAAAAGATAVQTVAQNAASAALLAATDLVKLTTGVATAGLTVQEIFNAAIGTADVTGLAAAHTGVFVTAYDTTNARAMVMLASSGANDILATADVVQLVGTINMSAADYALFGSAQFTLLA